MKKKTILTIVCILVGVVEIYFINLFLPQDFLGYSKNIDVARAERAELYEADSLIYILNIDGKYVDFIVKDDNVYVINILKRSTLIGEKYKIGVCSTFNFSNCISNDADNLSWHTVHRGSLLSDDSLKNIRYAIIDSASSPAEEHAEVCEFEYNSVFYNLYIEK